MFKVLITGGYGFVGSQLLTRLSGHDITVVDNLLSGAELTFPHVRFVHGDIRDHDLMSTLVPQHDIIVHLAAIVGEPACVIDADFSYQVNVIGTQNVIDNMTHNQRLIFTSTSSVYGNRPNELVTEESKPIPINNYALQKYKSEIDIKEAAIDYIILRPVTAFGITQRTRLDLLVNTLIYEGLSFGKIEVYEPNIMRPIIHVDDFARILVQAIDHKLPWNEVYNIGDSFYNMTKLELAKRIANLTGAIVIEKEGSSLDPRDYDVSFDKLIGTGFRPGGNRLNQAVNEIKKAQYTIAENPKSFSTPYKVEQFLKESK